MPCLQSHLAWLVPCQQVLGLWEVYLSLVILSIQCPPGTEEKLWLTSSKTRHINKISLLEFIEGRGRQWQENTSLQQVARLNDTLCALKAITITSSYWRLSAIIFLSLFTFSSLSMLSYGYSADANNWAALRLLSVIICKTPHRPKYVGIVNLLTKSSQPWSWYRILNWQTAVSSVGRVSWEDIIIGELSWFRAVICCWCSLSLSLC